MFVVGIRESHGFNGIPDKVHASRVDFRFPGESKFQNPEAQLSLPRANSY